MCTFPKEEKMKLGSEQKLWNPIFNSDVETEDFHGNHKVDLV